MNTRGLGGMKVNEHKRISGVGHKGQCTQEDFLGGENMKVNEHTRIFWGEKT